MLSQVFKPTLPTGISSYRITKVGLTLKYSSPTVGIFIVSIRGVTGTTPNSTVYCSQTIRESALSSGYSTYNVTFPDCPDLDPTKSYAVAITWSFDSKACVVEYQSRNATGRTLFKSSNGTSWSGSSNQSLLFKMYGVTTTTNAPGPVVTSTTTATSTTLQGITVKLQPSANGSTLMSHYFRALNAPDQP
jgi:hypothetical protein